jgi:hypothetical protein
MMNKVKPVFEKLERLNTQHPVKIIEYIDSSYPQYSGMCYYDPKIKELRSVDESIVNFYFDPFHSVLHIRGYK